MTINGIVLLSGTPASGKDTITDLICESSSFLTRLRRHKTGNSGRIDETYDFVDKAEFERMANNGEFVQYHYRYGRGYGVARKTLEDSWRQGKVPIIHVGKYENIAPFYALQAVNVLSVLLLTSREQTQQRLQFRHEGDEEEIRERMKAYEEERSELSDLIRSGAVINFDLMLSNSSNDPGQNSKLIEAALGIMLNG